MWRKAVIVIGEIKQKLLLGAKTFTEPHVILFEMRRYDLCNKLNELVILLDPQNLSEALHIVASAISE